MTVIRDFVWYELATPDKAAAEAFYAAVCGWTLADSGMPGGGYALARIGERPIAGLMGPMPGCDMSGRFGWMGYVGVDDVPATVARVESLGGRLLFGPMEVPEVGPFAVVADPQGAVLGLFAPVMATSPLAPMTPGAFAWHELTTADPVAAMTFHAEMFGWRADQVFPMGALGDYRLFAGEAGAIGGMAPAPEGVAPGWLYYVAVDDIDAAIERIGTAGGRLVLDPMEVPGGAFVVQATDPQGIRFALVGPRHK